MSIINRDRFIPNAHFFPFFFLLYGNYSYLCTYGHENHPHQCHQDYLPHPVGRSHPVLDVPWRGLQPSDAGNDRGDGLDMDATVLPLRHLGSGVPRLAMEADAGSDSFERRRTGARRSGGAHLRLPECRIPVVCRQSDHPAHRGVHPLRRAETLRRHLILQGPRHRGDRTGCRYADRTGLFRTDPAAGDEHVRHLLREDWHVARPHPGRFLTDRLARHRRLCCRRPYPAPPAAEELLYI